MIQEYIPIAFQLDIGESLRMVERDNKLESGGIGGVRYLKEPWRRHPTQKTAFVALTLKMRKQQTKCYVMHCSLKADS